MNAVNAQLDFFFDPACPFAWMTSRWVEEVRVVGASTGRLDLTVRYRPIALRLLNPDTDPDTPIGALHRRGLQLLRVVRAVGERHGEEAVGDLYTALGTAIHEQPTTATEFQGIANEQAARPADLAALLRSLDLDEDLAGAADDERHDEAITASTEEALARVGGDVGTPILTFGPPDGPSFFGPVISERPRGVAALELFEATRTLAGYAPFAELKRSLCVFPATAAFAQLR